MPLDQLADLVADLGFDGIELPVREGYQVNPSNVREMLPHARDLFARKGLVIASVASSITVDIIESMGQANIPLLRVMIPIDLSLGYLDSVKKYQDSVLEIQALLVANNVKIGMQNHQGHHVGSALGLQHLLSGLPQSIAGAVLDFAHCGLDGEPVDMALDLLKDRLLLLNLKNAYKHRIGYNDFGEAEWQVIWSTARHGYYSWKETIDLIVEKNISIDICLPAEYGKIGLKGQLMDTEVLSLIKTDISYLKSLLSEKDL